MYVFCLLSICGYDIQQLRNKYPWVAEITYVSGMDMGEAKVAEMLNYNHYSRHHTHLIFFFFFSVPSFISGVHHFG